MRFYFHYLSKNNQLLARVLEPLIVPPYMNFRVVDVENKSMNKVFNIKTEGTKVYKCHKYKMRDCFELDTIVQKKSGVLRICSVGPAYLNEANRLIIR